MFIKKNAHFFVILITSISAALFFIINMMTTRPGSSSGNGNPAILIMMPLVILFIALIYCWYRLILQSRVEKKVLNWGLGIIMIHWICGIFFQRQSFLKYRDYLYEVSKEKHGQSDWEYINSITSGLTIHVNNQYFNLNTFLLFLTLSLFMGILIYVLRQRNTVMGQ